jgi:hypothetical protein
MKEGSLIFKLEHQIDMHCKRTLYVDCKNNPSLQWMIFTQKTTTRILNLKVISEFNLMLLKELSKEGERLTYTGTSINDWSPMGRSDCNRRRFTV